MEPRLTRPFEESVLRDWKVLENQRFAVACRQIHEYVFRPTINSSSEWKIINFKVLFLSLRL